MFWGHGARKTHGGRLFRLVDGARGWGGEQRGEGWGLDYGGGVGLHVPVQLQCSFKLDYHAFKTMDKVEHAPVNTMVCR